MCRLSTPEILAVSSTFDHEEFERLARLGSQTTSHGIAWKQKDWSEEDVRSDLQPTRIYRNGWRSSKCHLALRCHAPLHYRTAPGVPKIRSVAKLMTRNHNCHHRRVPPPDWSRFRRPWFRNRGTTTARLTLDFFRVLYPLLACPKHVSLCTISIVHRVFVRGSNLLPEFCPRC